MVNFMNKKNIIYIFFLGIFVGLLYYIRINYFIVSIDTEAFINNSHDIINSWYSIGRFSLGFYIKLFDLLPFNMMFNNIMALVLYFIAVLLLVKDFQRGDFSYKKRIVMGLFILTSPLLAEQYAFTLQNVEVSISYLLLVIVMIGLSRAIYKRKYIYYLLTPFLILVFGTYQSFYLMYITLSIIYFLEYYDRDLELKKHIKIISIYVGIMLLYMVLTVVVGNVVNNLLEVEETGYLFSQMNWFNGNFIKGILYCGYYFVSVLFGLGVDNNLGFSFLLVIVLFYLKNDLRDEKIFYKLVMLSLFISPFLISIFFGTITFSRAQFSIPIILAYLYSKFLDNKKVFMIAIIFIVVQVISTGYLFFIDLERYRNDVKLFEYVKEIDNDSNLPIIFVGNVNYERMFKGEVLGKSFYNWDYKTERLSNDRITGFMKVHDFSYKIPTIEQIAEVKNKYHEYHDLVTYEEEYVVVNLDKYNN